MLGKYLYNLRKSRVLTESARVAAVEGLDGWKFKNNALTKKFTFPNFEYASNFILRYNNHSDKMVWENVYDTVTVSLWDTEFDAVTTKEVELANYLDTVYDAALDMENMLDEDFYTHESIITPMETIKNTGDLKTQITYTSFPKYKHLNHLEIRP